MTPEDAVVLRDFLLDELEREFDATRSLIAAMPEDGRTFRPFPKAAPALDLAWLIVDAETVLLGAIAQGSFEEMRPSDDMPETFAELLSYADALIPALRDSVRKLDGDTLAQEVAFEESMRPLVGHLAYVLEHTMYHRGQLVLYMRAMGARVPGAAGGGR